MFLIQIRDTETDRTVHNQILHVESIDEVISHLYKKFYFIPRSINLNEVENVGVWYGVIRDRFIKYQNPQIEIIDLNKVPDGYSWC